MIIKTLKELSEMVLGELSEIKSNNQLIKGVSINSKAIKTGNLFIPIIRNKNGHDFVKEAIKNGAVAVLWQRNQPSPPKEVPVIFVDDTLEALQNLAINYRSELNATFVGVTGSNGKTTTKDMIASILSTSFKVHKTQGNLNSNYGLPLTILDIPKDTQIAVLEMGMSARGEIRDLSKIAKPDIAVITMIGLSHISNLGSRLEIAKAKLEITEYLMAGGVLVYNGDEPLLEHEIKGKINNRFRTISFGKLKSNDVYVSSILSDSDNIRFKINSKDNPVYQLQLLGKHNIFNALAAITVAKELGVKEDQIIKGLYDLTLSGMRMEKISSKFGFTIINDAWNASPDSVQAAIETFQDLTGVKRRIIVLGDMLELGEDEIEYHKKIGEMINPQKIDILFTYGKLAKYIGDEVKKREAKFLIKSHLIMSELISDLMLLVDKGDVILIKGSRAMNLELIVDELMKKD